MFEHLMTSSKFRQGEVVAFQGELYKVIDVEPLDNPEPFKYEYTLKRLIGEEEIAVPEKELLADQIA